MKTKYAIIGGGVAGLSAAIRLAELGEEPLVIEGGEYPAHKICGEFLSSECIAHLSKWNIHPLKITKAIIHTASNHLVFPFASSAGGLSHLELEPSLIKHALLCGVKLMTNTPIQMLQQKSHRTDSCLIHLANNQTIEAANVIIAAGKFNPASRPSEMRYMGFKAHFKNPDLKIGQLEMFSFPGAYLGVSPVENGKVNVACIADIPKIGNADPQVFIQSLILQNPYLHTMLPTKNNLFKQWMVSVIPDFGFRQTPDWLDCYFIGDAAMTIPPACGNGLSLAIFGGRLVGEYALNHRYLEFKTIWRQQCTSQLFWGKILHKLMLTPSYSKQIIRLAKNFPFISNKLFDLTRFQST